MQTRSQMWTTMIFNSSGSPIMSIILTSRIRQRSNNVTGSTKSTGLINQALTLSTFAVNTLVLHLLSATFLSWSVPTKTLVSLWLSTGTMERLSPATTGLLSATNIWTQNKDSQISLISWQRWTLTCHQERLLLLVAATLVRSVLGSEINTPTSQLLAGLHLLSYSH